MTSRPTRGAALATVAALVAAPALVRAQSPAPDLLALRLASSPADDTMPVIEAQQSGAFAKAGLDVQLTRSASGSAVAAAVAGGAVDIGKSSIVSVINAHAKGLPFVYISPASMYNPAVPDGALIVGTASAIKTAKDLNGQIVGVPALNDLNAVATRAWVDQNGGDSKTIQFVEIPISAQLAALDQGRIAAGGIINPFLSEAVTTGRARMLAPFYSAIANKFMLSGWFTTTDFVAKHRDAIAKFQRIVETNSIWANAHHADTVPMLAAWSGMTVDQASHLQRMTMGTRISADDIQPVIDLMAKYGAIAKPFDAHEMIVDFPK